MLILGWGGGGCFANPFSSLPRASVHFSSPLCLCMLHLRLRSSLITSSSRCECIYNGERVHFAPSHPPSDWLLCVCLSVCVRQSLHARREHTGCRRANICQGDLECQSWRVVTCVCVAKASMLLFAEIRDSGSFSPPVTPISSFHCALCPFFLSQAARKARFCAVFG